MATTIKNSNIKATPRTLARSAVVSAVSSIELFNRPRAKDRISMSIIANVRSWEQIGKAFLLKKKEDIETGNGRTLSVASVVRLLDSKFQAISPGESETINQLISLRDEAMHLDLDFIPDDLAAHLLYFSLKAFKEFLKKNFPSYTREINANFISVNFQPTYTYVVCINKVLSVRGGLKNNRLAFLLERGLHNAQSDTEFKQSDWVAKVRSLRGKRLTKSALLLRKYAGEHDSVFFITVEAPSKYGKADVTLSKGRHGAKTKITVVSSDPEDTHPYLTGELANKLGVGRNSVQKAIKELGLKGNQDHHLAVRSGKSTFIQRYSELALEKIRSHIKS